MDLQKIQPLDLPNGLEEVKDSAKGPDIEAQSSNTQTANTHTRDETAESVPYSIFTKTEKRWISYIASFGAMFSTLSSYIYFPALVPMSNDLHVSITLMNLTVTCYLVMAGIAPAFMGDFADQGGQRPAYILMFSLAAGSNVGLALQTSYPALFVLRMIQSAGTSGSYGAAYGVLADITTVSERGSFVGSLILFTTAAPSFGPVVAGILAEKLGWRWIFWLLVILTGSYWGVVITLLPETQRKLVGNGEILTRGVHRSLFDLLVKSRKTRTDEGSAKRKRHGPNPFKCIHMLFSKVNFAIILMGSITYSVKMTLQTSLAAQCIDVYSLDYLQAGLVYLPSGIGGAIASYCAGKFLDSNIKKVASEHGRDSGYRRGDNIAGFPIEEARLKGVYALVVLSAASTVGYGVSLMKSTHISVPLIMQFISGAATSAIFTFCGTLLTDLNPHASATVQPSYNLIRCVGAGASIAAQQPLADAAGLGWCFGTFGIVMLAAAPLAFIIRRYGMNWRV